VNISVALVSSRSSYIVVRDRKALNLVARFGASPKFFKRLSSDSEAIASELTGAEFRQASFASRVDDKAVRNAFGSLCIIARRIGCQGFEAQRSAH